MGIEMNILILTGKFGMGHWAAAQSLRQQLLREFPGAAVTVEDFPAYAAPNVSEVWYKFFRLLVSHGSQLFNAYYKAASLGQTDARPPFEGLFLDKLAELLQRCRPDVVIATHPICAQLVSRLKEEAKKKEGRCLDLPLITCITDVSSHPEWINRNTDCYLVPGREVRKGLEERGVSSDRICVTGIPVREEFCSLQREKGRQFVLPSGDKEENVHIQGQNCIVNPQKAVAEMQGKKRKHELLIMGGGLGLLPKADGFYEELNTIPDTHVTIITGRNQRLFERLRGRWENIEVIGFTERVWEYMQIADMIVTKPGGITLFECISAQVPVFAWPPALCQEKNNARWMVREEIGWVAKKENCAGEIRELLQDEKKLFRAAAHMEQLRKQLERESLYQLVGAIDRKTARAAV